MLDGMGEVYRLAALLEKRAGLAQKIPSLTLTMTPDAMQAVGEALRLTADAAAASQRELEANREMIATTRRFLAMMDSSPIAWTVTYIASRIVDKIRKRLAR